uniref:Uncharacterized protein n=1 Tax=Caenorhabditis japonica TaxID=281687 RepID=A0A8R1IV26_CAEJA
MMKHVSETVLGSNFCVLHRSLIIYSAINQNACYVIGIWSHEGKRREEKKKWKENATLMNSDKNNIEKRNA